MKKKEEGFSIIEIILVLGVIGILSSFIVPKTREYLAVAKDSKAINILQNIRMASESYYLENGDNIIENQETIVDIMPKLSKYIREDIELTNDQLLIEIGGSKENKTSDIVYGGKVEMYIDSNKEIMLRPYGDTKDYSIKGQEWSKL